MFENDGDSLAGADTDANGAVARLAFPELMVELEATAGA